MEHSDFTLKLNDIPVIDNHCHPPLKSSIETESEFKRFFTESFDPRIVSSHVQNTLFIHKAFGTSTLCLDEAASQISRPHRAKPVGDGRVCASDRPARQHRRHDYGLRVSSRRQSLG